MCNLAVVASDIMKKGSEEKESSCEKGKENLAVRKAGNRVSDLERGGAD